jgi:hypothetical protein
MKIHVISDLHREFGFMDISFSNADVVVIAGDVNVGNQGYSMDLIDDQKYSGDLRFREPRILSRQLPENYLMARMFMS